MRAGHYNHFYSKISKSFNGCSWITRFIWIGCHNSRLANSENSVYKSLFNHNSWSFLNKDWAI